MKFNKFNEEQYTDLTHNRSSWKWMRQMAVGDESAALAEGKATAVTYAGKIRIKISVRTLPNKDFIITRVA